MSVWNLTMHHAASGTVENLGAYAVRAALQGVLDTRIEELADEHDGLVRVFPGVGEDVTNASFGDGHSVYFQIASIQSEEGTAITTPLNTWDQLSNKLFRHLSVKDLLAVKPRPQWSDDELDTIGGAADGSEYRSNPVSVPLAMHTSQVTDGMMYRASAKVQIVQRLRDAEPFITLGRAARVTDRIEHVPGSRFSLTPAEAVELAHTLLLAAEVACEGTTQEVAL